MKQGMSLKRPRNLATSQPLPISYFSSCSHFALHANTTTITTCLSHYFMPMRLCVIPRKHFGVKQPR